MKTRKSLLIIGMALVTSFAFSQKKEIKQAERAIKSNKYTEALSILDQAEPLVSSADDATKAQYYVLRAKALGTSVGATPEQLTSAAEAMSQAISFRKKVEDDEQETIHAIRAGLINSAVRDQNGGRNEEAANKLITSFNLTKEPSDLYFAAGNMVNAGKYDKALEYYQKLLDIGYTGQVQEFVATNKETGEVTPFDDEHMRNIAVRSGEYIKPATRMTESRKGEILRNMTLIYIQEGNTDKALSIMETARAENPDDVYLMRAEADMNYNLGNFQKYNELMNKIVATDPDNPELHFNLGVASAELGENDKALSYYRRALELNPQYEAALINMAVIQLAAEGPLVEQMNSLGNSAADNRKYDELRKQREGIYKETLPLLEKALKINSKNQEVIRTMMNIYSQLGEDAKEKEMRTKLQQLEGNN